MCLRICRSLALKLDYHGRLGHLEFHWVSSVKLSGLYHGVRPGLHLDFEGILFT